MEWRLQVGLDAPTHLLQQAVAPLLGSVWELVKASDAGLLKVAVDVIEAECRCHTDAPADSSCEPAGASSSTGLGQSGSGPVSERADAALALFAALACHSCDPNTLRRLLGLAATANASVLGAVCSAVCSAIARCEASEALPCAAPSRFFSFRGLGPCSHMPQLRGACSGPTTQKRPPPLWRYSRQHWRPG